MLFDPKLLSTGESSQLRAAWKNAPENGTGAVTAPVDALVLIELTVFGIRDQSS